MTWLPYPLSALVRSSVDDDMPIPGSTTVDPADASSWWYSPERHASPERFARSPHFTDFRERIKALTQVLNALDSGRPPGQLLPFMCLRRRIVEVRQDGTNIAFGNDAATMYGQGAQYLERVAALVADDTFPLDARRLSVRKLADSADHCADAAIGALEEAINALDPKKLGLASAFRRRREDIVEQTAIHAVEMHHKGLLRYAPGSQVHYVYALNRQLHERLGWPWSRAEDPFARKPLPASVVTACVDALESSLTESAIATSLAEDYLSRFSEAMQARVRAAGELPFPTLGDVDGCARPLRPSFGETPPVTLLMALTDDGAAYRPTTDAAPIAAYFLEQLRLTRAECIDVESTD